MSTSPIDVSFDQCLFVLDAQTYQAFVDALDHLPLPSPKLQRLLRRHPIWEA